MKVVIALGGSILVPSTPDVEFIESFSKMLVKFSKKGNRALVVAGGGKMAKEYVRAARELGADEELCDEIGITGTEMNAMLLQSALGEAALEGIQKDFKKALETDRIFVTGGTVPGQTTDTVAAQLASYCKADLLIIATNVDGVYESDPRANPDAKRFERLSPGDLIGIVTRPKYEAGSINVVDPKAAEIIREEGIKTVVLDGRELENLENAVNGKSCSGTLIE